jgi:hypothetical protein
MKEVRFGTLGGLEISASPSAFVGSLVLWLGLSGIAIALLKLPAGEAVTGALLAAALQILSETLHQLGHARAARQSGHPMSGIRFWGLLASSLYPTDEPALPAAIHIRRALGGPTISALVTILAAIILLVLEYAGASGGLWWVAVYFFVVNLLVFALGSFLPLGFTDGSTLLYWRRKA